MFNSIRPVTSTTAVLVLLTSAPSYAQTAEFKCPKPGTVIEFSDTTRVRWIQADGNRCQTTLRSPDARVQVLEERGKDIPGYFYAPTFSARADRGTAFIDQVKPWTLWPLQVGKKLSARYDGAAGQAQYQGTWFETVTVDSYEKLTTKAGTFDVFVVTRKEEAISHPYKSTFKQWYAPALGAPVKFTFTDNRGVSSSGEAVSISQ